jgi:NitT/TauT family transport system ATP-binding protein
MNYFNLYNVSKVFKNNNKEITVLDNINISINKEDLVCIVGQSGCGKTTLLRMMAGFEKVSSGKILCNNTKITKPQMKYAYIFQDYNQLLPWKTVRQNIAYPLEIKNYNKLVIKNKVREFLELVGLLEYADYYPYTLSGGMKQRVAIARALAMNPELLFMDEPFSALDTINREKLNKELINIWKELKITIIFVTHNLDEAIYLSNKIIIIGGKPGRIINIIQNNVEGQRLPSNKGYTELWNFLYNSVKLNN